MASLQKKMKVGGATLACARAGAKVTHVDAAKGIMQWAGEIYRLRGLGYSAVKAAVVGTKQVGGAIAASTGLNKAPNIEIREYIYDMHRQLAAADIVICSA